MKREMRHMVWAALILCSAPLCAQMAERDIRSRLDAIYAGKADEVRSELPSLLSRNPNDAGVKYIQAVLTTDGAMAVARYEEIAQKFPESVWADDALYKIYQYNYSMGLYKKADEVMERLRAAYPNSIYASVGSDSQPKRIDTVPAQKTGSVVKPETAGAQNAGAVKKPETVGTQNAATVKKADTVKKPAATPKREPVAGGVYSVQAGLFSTEANARKAAEHFTAQTGREASVKPKTSGEKTVYLVVFEGFATAESAKEFSADIRTQHKIDSFVTPR